MNKPRTRFEVAAAELAAIGIALTLHPGTYGVNFAAGSTDATAYFTDDLDDAVEHGRALAASALGGFIARGLRAQAAADRAIAEATKKAPRRRQRRPLKMTPKAIRRRMIRAHNQRLRARALQAAASRQDDCGAPRK